MRFRRASTDSWELRDIHPLFVSLLAELPKVAARHKKRSPDFIPTRSAGRTTRSFAAIGRST